MARDKDTVFIHLVTATTAADDTSSHTVKLQPIDQAYPTGAVDCTQGTSEQARWYPDTDLDEDQHYDVYVDDVKIGRILSYNSLPAIGG
jgi:hypothetical protein